MKIAVEGCCHGELDKIYETIQHLEQKNNMKVDLLLICGDFQAVRNRGDLQAMAVPPKYQRLNTFYKYYSGEKVAPVLTIFIGGNHEASNYMQELPYGGWVAPNIYYMGYGGIVEIGGLRIAGLSGIYKGKDFQRGHFERPPYNESTKRSVYHVRNLEVFRFKQVSRPVDIFLSHDWPRGVYHYGDVNSLVRFKKFLKDEIESNTLGSPPAEELLHLLKPTYWFSAHLHVKFPALVQHQDVNGEEKLTRFLSLDKCLPKRRFLQVIDVPHDSSQPMKIHLDPEWLAILKSTNHLLKLSPVAQYMPGLGGSDRWDFKVTDNEIEAVKKDFDGNLVLPENFVTTAPCHESTFTSPQKRADIYVNPQTTLLCTMLEITDPNAVFLGIGSHFKDEDIPVNPDPADLDDDVDDDDDGVSSDINSSIDTSCNDSFSLNTNDSFSLNTTDILNDTSDMASANLSVLSNSTDASIVSIAEEEDELNAILLAQKEAQSENTNGKDSVSLGASSAEGEDDELEDILKAQKSIQGGSTTSAGDTTTKGDHSKSEMSVSTSELSGVLEINADSQSDAFTSSLEEEKVPSAASLTSATLDEGKPPSKRCDVSDVEISPQSKKLRRRNQNMYSSAEDEGE